MLAAPASFHAPREGSGFVPAMSLHRACRGHTPILPPARLNSFLAAGTRGEASHNAAGTLLWTLDGDADVPLHGNDRVAAKPALAGV